MTRIAHVSAKLLNGRGVLERVRRVHVEEPAAVGAELLDGDLAGDRPAGDELLGAASTVSAAREAVEVLDHALAHEHDREDERQRQQDRGPWCG